VLQGPSDLSAAPLFADIELSKCRHEKVTRSWEIPTFHIFSWEFSTFVIHGKIYWRSFHFKVRGNTICIIFAIILSYWVLCMWMVLDITTTILLLPCQLGIGRKPQIISAYWARHQRSKATPTLEAVFRVKLIFPDMIISLYKFSLFGSYRSAHTYPHSNTTKLISVWPTIHKLRNTIWFLKLPMTSFHQMLHPL
jgi:hypothetical protein